MDSPSEGPSSQGPEAAGPGGVCSSCIAGGETADFGGIPSPCNLDANRASISEAEARAMGFGPGLDAYAHDFSAPLKWMPPALSGRRSPAPTGYSNETILTLSTRVVSMSRRAPVPEGCPERLEVVFDATLSTADGALSLDGTLEATLTRTFPSQAWGKFDLARATGTMRITPWAGARPTLGAVGMRLFTWPDRMRGELEITLTEDTPPSSLPDRDWLLDGVFPVDACHSSSEPLDPSIPSSLLAGRSANEIRAELAALMAARSPAQGTWSDGSSTGVTMTLGPPSDVCVGSQGELHYRAGLGIRTDDMRVNVEERVLSFARVKSDGSIDDAWFELIESDPLNDRGYSSKGLLSLHLLGKVAPGASRGKLVEQGPAPDGGASTAGSGATLTWDVAP